MARKYPDEDPWTILGGSLLVGAFFGLDAFLLILLPTGIPVAAAALAALIVCVVATAATALGAGAIALDSRMSREKAEQLATGVQAARNVSTDYCQEPVRKTGLELMKKGDQTAVSSRGR